MASIATRFDEHSRLLASASDLLGSAQSDLEHTLERQSSLDDLAVGLVKKSEDLERVMRSFETLVGQTLQNAEGKTLELADKIRVAISEVVEAATKRFADATDEMRRTAGSIKSELDLTRAELRKGVIEMPEEAEESTTAIRRAVSEQISALKELSEIVASPAAPSTSRSRATCGRPLLRVRRNRRCAARHSLNSAPRNRRSPRPACVARWSPAKRRCVRAAMPARRSRAAGCATC